MVFGYKLDPTVGPSVMQKSPSSPAEEQTPKVQHVVCVLLWILIVDTAEEAMKKCETVITSYQLLESHM